MTKADEYCTQLRNENRILLAQLEAAKEQVATSMLLCADHQSLLVKHLALRDAAKLALDLLTKKPEVIDKDYYKNYCQQHDSAVEALRKAGT